MQGIPAAVAEATGLSYQPLHRSCALVSTTAQQGCSHLQSREQAAAMRAGYGVAGATHGTLLTYTRVPVTAGAASANGKWIAGEQNTGSDRNIHKEIKARLRKQASEAQYRKPTSTENISVKDPQRCGNVNATGFHR